MLQGQIFIFEDEEDVNVKWTYTNGMTLKNYI